MPFRVRTTGTRLPPTSATTAAGIETARLPPLCLSSVVKVGDGRTSPLCVFPLIDEDLGSLGNILRGSANGNRTPAGSHRTGNPSDINVSQAQQCALSPRVGRHRFSEDGLVAGLAIIECRRASPVNCDDRSGHERGTVSREEDRNIRDLARLCLSTEGLHARRFLPAS